MRPGLDLRFDGDPVDAPVGHARGKGLDVCLRAGCRREHQDLRVERAGLPQDAQLIEQALVSPPGEKRLGVVVHEHGHGEDSALAEDLERFERATAVLALSTSVAVRSSTPSQKAQSPALRSSGRCSSHA